MPEMQPVATQIQPPDPMKGINTYAGILGLQQQKQALQTGQYQQQAVAADAQQAQQKNQELQAAQSLALNGAKSGKYTKADGSLDRQKMADDISAVAPTYGQGIAGQLLSQANEVVSNKQALQNLSESQQKQVGKTLSSLAADPNVTHSDVIDALDNIVDANPQLRRWAISASGAIPPGAQGAQLQQLLQRAAAATSGEPQVGASTIDTGGAIQPGTTNRFTGAFTPAGGSIPKTLAPQIISPPLGGGPAQVGGAAGTTPRPIGGSGGGIWQPAPGQAANVGAMAQDDAGRYSQISQEGTNAQTGAQLADQVAQLAEQVRTGKLSKEWTDRLTVLQQHDPGLTARQMLSKYAAQLKTMATAGATTDASRSQIDEGMPSPESMGPDAVKEAAQYVGGIFRMRGARQAYADQYAGKMGSSLGVRAADDAFMRSADPTVFTYTSLPAGAERQQFLMKHGLNTPEKLQAFKQRLNQIHQYAGAE